MAWGLLVVVEVAIVLLTAGLADGYESVTTAYLMLSLLAVGLLLRPATRAHVASSTW